MPDDLISEVDRLSGQRIETCYHCHKCAAGCPLVGTMEYGPDRLLRMAALNQRDALLRSGDIWLCAGCFTCTARCPNGIDLAAVMDALRQLALRGGYPTGEGDVLLFHRLFLSVMKLFGRSHEATLLGLFKILSHVPLRNDLGAGLALVARGKVPLLPRRSQAGKEVRRIFQRSV